MTTSTIDHKAPAASDTPTKGQDNRCDRYDALRICWDVTNDRRVKNCSRRRRPDVEKVGVVVTETPNGRVAGFQGLHVCGSVWACPVCSAKIAAVRSTELVTAMERWHKRGGRLVFATFTVRHKASDHLEDVWDAVSGGWGAVTSGRGWLREQDKYGTHGIKTRTLVRQKNKVKYKVEVEAGWIPTVRAVEVTHGGNGWHVHVHAILFVSGDCTAEMAQALGESMFGRWVPAVVRKGMGVPSQARGVDVRMILGDDFKAIGEYFQKSVYHGPRDAKGAAGETVAGGFKEAKNGNRTPFQILRDIVRLGEESDVALWQLWETVSKGRRQLTWSHGLREFLELGVEKTDEEIAEEEAQGTKVLELDDDELASITRCLGQFKTAVEKHQGEWTFAAVLETMARLFYQRK